MKKTKSYYIFQTVNALIMLLVIVVTLYPFLYLVAQSFSSQAAIYNGEVVLWPVDFNLDTYKAVLSKPDFFMYYGNTILYAVLGTFLALVGTAFLAYPLSKPRLRLNRYITPFVLFTMFFNGGLIPNYILIAQTLKMRDTIWAIIVPGAISAYYTLLMRSFFAGIPEEMEEAAAIDGMGQLGIFFRIVLPLSKPILATMLLFNMVNIWNNWFGPSIYLQSKDKWPVSLFLRQLIDGAVNVNEFSAGASSDMIAQISSNIKSCAMVITMLPIIIIYPFVQKHFVQGMMIGAVKG